MAPGPALGLGGPYSAPFLAMPFPVGWEPEERGQGPGSPLIECSECLGVLENPLDCREIPEKAMATHSSTLAWKTPWMEEPGGLQSMGSLSRTRLSDFTFTFHFHALEKEMATHSSVLAWRIPGRGSLVGCHLWGHTESGTTEVT